MFTDCAEYLFKSVFGKLPGQGDKLLARSPHAAKVRFHSMYVWGLVANGATALMGEETASGTGILNPRRDAISRMLKYMDVNPDVVFVVSNSPTHKRASAYPATDDTTRKGVQTSYQGSPFIHYHWHSVPGMAAIHATESTALTGAHEFCHAFPVTPTPSLPTCTSTATLPSIGRWGGRCPPCSRSTQAVIMALMLITLILWAGRHITACARMQTTRR